MKRFLVLALAVACTFMVGCFGSDGDENPVGATTVTSTVVALNKVVTVPSTGINFPSIRSAIHWKEIVIRVQGANGPIDVAPATYSYTAPNLVLTYNLVAQKADLAASTFNSTTQQLTYQVVRPADGFVYATITEAASDKATTTTGTPTPAATSLTIIANTDGTYSVTAPAGATTQTYAYQLFAEKIEYWNGTAYVELATNATGIPSTNTTFQVTFNTLVKNATSSWTMQAKRVDTGSTFTLATPADAARFEVIQSTVGTKSVLTIRVLPPSGTDTRQLTAGKQYTVTFTAASIARNDAQTATLGAITRTFTTAQ